jgi:hypothetical protein
MATVVLECRPPRRGVDSGMRVVYCDITLSTRNTIGPNRSGLLAAFSGNEALQWYHGPGHLSARRRTQADGRVVGVVSKLIARIMWFAVMNKQIPVNETSHSDHECTTSARACEGFMPCDLLHTVRDADRIARTNPAR